MFAHMELRVYINNKSRVITQVCGESVEREEELGGNTTIYVCAYIVDIITPAYILM